MCMFCQDGGYAPFHLPKKHQLGAGAGGAGDFDGYIPIYTGLIFPPKPVYDLPDAITALRSWGETADGTPLTRSWSGDTIYYSIPTTYEYGAPDAFGGVEGIGFQPMSAHKHDMAVAAFELWDDLIAVDMEETTGVTGNVIAMAYSTETALNASGVTGTYAQTHVSGVGPDYTIDKASIWLSSFWDSLREDSAIYFGSRGFSTYLHEIGHTLGLSHPGDYDASRGPASYFWDADYVQDTRQYTVMSYFGGWQDADLDGVWTFTTDPVAGFRTKFASTPMLHDVAAIQEAYGADTHTREGHTTYGFHSTAGRNVFDFTINRDPIVTIWDGNGIDTLDVSGFTQNQVVNLNPGTYSSIGRLVDNVAIAFGCDIENAVGGSGNDTIIGNRLDNMLSGGAGVDEITGGEGNDTMDGGTGADIMRGGRGNDIYVVDTLADSVIETFDPYVDKVIVKVTGYMLPTYVENGDVGVETGLTLRGNDLANVLTGNIGDDFLFGGALGDTLDGGRGNDRLNGGTGADTMRGGFGDDIYSVDSLADQVRENVLEGTDLVSVVVNNYVLPTNVENGLINTATGLTLSGNSGNNVLTGNTGMDTLNGAGGHDELHGGDNADRLNGGAGKDFLFGETGMDTFVFRRGEADLDTVIDFDGAGALSGDRFEFQGYGAGASFFQLDPTHWMVNSADGLVHETITLRNAASVHWSDFAFIG